MRVWLYYRLSNDDDKEQNSLLNQRKITLEYALLNGYIVAGESSDDNASGMNFLREGIREIVNRSVLPPIPNPAPANFGLIGWFDSLKTISY